MIMIKSELVQKPASSNAWIWAESPKSWFYDTWCHNMSEQPYDTTHCTIAHITCLQNDLRIKYVRYEMPALILQSILPLYIIWPSRVMVKVGLAA